MTYTKIVCTLGPASDDETTLRAMIDAGMNLARLNCSHGNHDEKAAKIALVRSLATPERPIGILLDNKGPEIRTGELEQHTPITVATGDTLTLSTTQSTGNQQTLSVDYAGIVDDVVVGDTVLIDDGSVSLMVEEVTQDSLVCRVQNNGTIGERKGVNLPGIASSLPSLTPKDIDDIRFGCEQRVDWYALSFVRSADDVHAARAALDEHGGKYIKIIAKIENQQGVDNFLEILDVADGIMVARGDLGVEVPLERVPLYQKAMISAANDAAKPIITATEMLDSMITNPRPTRAEITDVANAIWDGSDAVMLSGETAGGAYPIEAVRTMRAICDEIDIDTIDQPSDLETYGDITQAIATGAVLTAHATSATAIIVASVGGRTVREIRKHTPDCPIIALTQHSETYGQLTLTRGVYPYLVEPFADYDGLYETAQHIACTSGVAESDDTLIVVGGGSIGQLGQTNTLRIIPASS